MLKMKKILSILLALCFLMSVTAVAASAHEDRFGDRHNREHSWGEREHGWGEREHGWGENHHRFNDHHKKRHHHPAHWEKKRVGHREFRNNHWQTVFVYKMVYVAEYYDYHSY